MSRVAIVPATLRDACYVAANMRAADRAEIGAVVSMDEPAAVAAALVASSGDLAWTAHLEGQPVAAFGASIMLPHVASGWAFGTDRLRRAVPAITRHGLEQLKPTLVARGFVRFEIRTAADHDLSHRWIEAMGGRLETPEPYAYGRNGELFVTYGWSR